MGLGGGAEKLAGAITKVIERFDGIEGDAGLQKIEQTSSDGRIFY